MLSYIWSMQVIVVFNGSLVLIVDLDKELQELVVVHGLQKIILLQEWSRHKWHLHITSNSFGEFKYIKVVWVHSIKEMKIVFDQLLNVFTR